MMTEEKTPKTVSEIKAEAEKEVIIINRAQFIDAVADAMTDDTLGEIIAKNPMLIMLFCVAQQVIWEKCVERTKPNDTTDKKKKEDIEYGKIWSE